ncbi:MAG: N-acetylneuraminate synthase family protein [Treponema sp.]|jgi:sialic acid synthase SpsE|nr:N-acetylneuraminate synthase family protein [Treponema sp.]
MSRSATLFFAPRGPYGPENVLVIAELGTSHGADPVKAGELIDAAADSGADCVKFQMVYADEILHPNTGTVRLPGGDIRLYDRFKKLETDPSFYAGLKEKVESRGLLFLCTPFGPRSAGDLKALSPEMVKIASPELNYTSLLEELVSWGIPLLLSSGVSRLGDIEQALETVSGLYGTSVRPVPAGNSVPVCLLHCVTSYPAPGEDYNLRVLRSLRDVFGVPAGVSDHSLDPVLVPALGTAMGAAVIEKHFCLSREDPGLDDPIALPPEDFAAMTAAVRRASSRGCEETLKEYAGEYGAERVERILGDGIKRLAPSERANYERTRRSIHALRDISPGEILDRGMFAVLRTEKILRPGLPPSWEGLIAGKKAGNFIPAGEGIRLEDIYTS